MKEPSKLVEKAIGRPSATWNNVEQRAMSFPVISTTLVAHGLCHNFVYALLHTWFHGHNNYAHVEKGLLADCQQLFLIAQLVESLSFIQEAVDLILDMVTFLLFLSLQGHFFFFFRFYFFYQVTFLFFFFSSFPDFFFFTRLLFLFDFISLATRQIAKVK